MENKGRNFQRWATPFLALSLCLAVALPARAAPPGETPFGVYDPPGDFTDDSDVQVEHLFLPWEDVYLPSLLEADEYAQQRNRAILATIEPWTWLRSERNTAEALIEGLTSGDYDHYMTDICIVLNLMKSPVTVRWAQEMDDPSGQFIWSNWEPETYITAYRRMIDLCRAEAPNIRVMWSPLGFDNMDEYYPGDEYVDLIGVSVFGFQEWEVDILGREMSFADIFAPRYDMAVKYGKPVVVPEIGYTGDAAYVENWNNAIRQSFDQFPDLVGVFYFNQKEVYPWPDNYGLPDWRFSEHVVTD